MLKRKAPGDEAGEPGAANAAANANANAAATDAPPAKKKRATQPVGNLTNAQKRLLCVQFARAKMTQQELCHWAKREFRLANLPHQSTISKILARARELTTMPARALPARRRGLVTHPELDVALSNWVLFARHRRLKLSGDSIKDQARRLAAKLGLESSMSFSNGWLGGFKKRHNIRLGGAATGAEPSAATAASGATAATVAELQPIAALYQPKDVFAMAETGLFYELSPEKPSGRATSSSGAAKPTPGGKPRLTLVLCVNADASERLEPMFIGPAPLVQPEPAATAFKGAAGGDQLEPDAGMFHYQHNARGWVTPVLFQDWVESLDTRMRDLDRRILLLVSRSTPTHICAGLALSHVRLELLPPSVERGVGPLEAGIIAAFKRRYRRYHMCHALDRHEARRADVISVEQTQAMRWIRYCWRDLPANVIRHYWRLSGLLPPASIGDADEGGPGVEASEDEIDREICDTVSSLEVLRPLMIDEFISPVEEDAGIHCPGMDDLDLVHTVPITMLTANFASTPTAAAAAATAVAATATAGAMAGAAPNASADFTPRVQDLHDRSTRRPSHSAGGAASTTTAAASSLLGNVSPSAGPLLGLTAVTGPASLAVDQSTLGSLSGNGAHNPMSTAANVTGTDGSATDEQLLACFRILLPELDRLRFDDRTKKSIRATFRRLKDAVEHPHQAFHGSRSSQIGGRNDMPVMPAVGLGGHIVYHPTQEPQLQLQSTSLQAQQTMGFHSMSMAMGMPGTSFQPTAPLSDETTSGAVQPPASVSVPDNTVI